MSRQTPVHVRCGECNSANVGKTVRAFVSFPVVKFSQDDHGNLVTEDFLAPVVDTSNVDTCDFPWKCFDCGAELSDEDLVVDQMSGVEAFAAALDSDLVRLLSLARSSAQAHDKGQASDQYSVMVARAAPALERLPAGYELLARAEAFIGGFEDDADQEPHVCQLLNAIRRLLADAGHPYTFSLTDPQ